MFDLGGDLSLRLPYRTHHTQQVLHSRCLLALCGGLFGPAGGVHPTNLLPSHLAEDKNSVALTECPCSLKIILGYIPGM